MSGLNINMSLDKFSKIQHPRGPRHYLEGVNFLIIFSWWVMYTTSVDHPYDLD